MWRRAMLLLVLAMGVPATAADAAVVDHGTFTSFQEFAPHLETDLPCLQGTAFIATGTESVRGNFVDAGAAGFHYFQIEKHTATLVPVDGQGPTYVESGNTDKFAFNTRASSGVFTFTHVNTDSFVAYQDGRRVGQATIRIHELEHFVMRDTDGDGQPDSVTVEFSKPRFTCP